ncbi:MAG: response regulator [Thermodesulfobacteriota bacterium]|nr:response regulator [Thermodesulfobacteriota bacterium]
MKRVLVIDDEAQIRMMLRQMLEREGYDVETASDGGEGIRLFCENPFHLIITDILMPEKEGVETIMELKKKFPDIKIIAISGGGRMGPEPYLRMARSTGAMRTLAKPVDREEMLRAIRELLE